MKRTTNAVIRKYVKRYFMLDLDQHCFSYKQSRSNKQSRFGIDISLISSVDEHVERIEVPPKGYPLGFVVCTENHRFVLFSTSQNYEMWINAFAACRAIKIRPEIKEANKCNIPIEKEVLKPQQHSKLEDANNPSKAVQFSHNDLNIRVNTDEKLPASSNGNTNANKIIKNEQIIEEKIKKTHQKSVSLCQETSKKVLIPKNRNEIKTERLLEERETPNTLINQIINKQPSRIEVFSIAKVAIPPQGTETHCNNAINKESNHNENSPNISVNKEPKKIPIIHCKIIKQDAKINSIHNYLAERMPEVIKLKSKDESSYNAMLSTQRYSIDEAHNKMSITQRGPIHLNIAKTDIKMLGLELFSPEELNREAIANRGHSYSVAACRKYVK